MANSKSKRLVTEGYPLNLLIELSKGCFVQTITQNDCAYLEYLIANNLTKPQRDAVLLRYRFKLTLEKCGDLLNCSKQYIEQCESSALNKLRELKEIRLFLETGRTEFSEKQHDDFSLKEIIGELKQEIATLSAVSERLKVVDCIGLIADAKRVNHFLELNLYQLHFSTRTYNCLKRAGFKCVRDILENWSELHKVRNLGVGSAIEIVDKMYQLGFKVPSYMLPTNDGDTEE